MLGRRSSLRNSVRAIIITRDNANHQGAAKRQLITQERSRTQCGTEPKVTHFPEHSTDPHSNCPATRHVLRELARPVIVTAGSSATSGTGKASSALGTGKGAEP
jgi:hypothetical protein